MARSTAPTTRSSESDAAYQTLTRVLTKVTESIFTTREKKTLAKLYDDATLMTDEGKHVEREKIWRGEGPQKQMRTWCILDVAMPVVSAIYPWPWPVRHWSPCSCSASRSVEFSGTILGRLKSLPGFHDPRFPR